jgi:peptidoglycan/xylan/chitin deacetylase (PgdA/CDA1 family)
VLGRERAGAHAADRELATLDEGRNGKEIQHAVECAASMARIACRAGLAASAIALLCGWSTSTSPVPRFHPPARGVVVPILMYHRVGTDATPMPAITRALTVSPSDFAAQMRWLHASGYHAITQGQLLGALLLGLPLPPRPVMITFDDGYRDVLWNAAPVLHRLHMPATAYVITGRIGGSDSSFLTWGELRQLERLGFTVGSHTVHHVDLTLEPPESAVSELVDSKRVLEQRLHRPVPWFAYPAGRFDAAVVAEAAHAGYLLAVTTQPGAVQRNRLELHRFEVLDTTGRNGLKALLASHAR